MYNRLTSNLANPLSRKSELPEIIRYLSEALVWSEQNNNDFFQYFLLSHFMKLNIQGLFFEILCENECKDIRIQLIQSANILIHNLDKLENKQYLLNSDFFHLLVYLDFDFSNDEITENYMSFLKGLAANLPRKLLLSYVMLTKFKVFKQAFLFFDYSDAMIKNASRTVILTIIKLNDPRIFEYLRIFEFTNKVMQGVVRLWEKFSREVPCENKLRVEQYVSAISDDLCYINDLLEHVEELNFDVCHKFVSFGVPWLIENISKELNTGTLNFIPSGYVIFSILEYLKCSYILNILVISLFSSKISEKMSYFTTKGSIPNNQLDVLEEYQGPIDNIIKHQVYAFLNDLKMCPITLLIMNNAISNEHLSKKVLYECQLLPKEDLKQQRLIRQILQDKHDYSSDRVLTEFLIKISTGNYPKFTMFLACRIILICSFFPSDIFLPQFLFEVNREIADVIAKLLIMIKSENLPDILLEAFEEASNNVKQYKWEEKIEFPKEILTKSDLSEQGIYRLPSSTFERYQNFFHKFFLLRKVKNLIFGEKIQNEGGVRKNSELADLTCNDGRVIIECLDNLKLIVQDFEIIVIGENGKEKGFRLRFIEVMVEGKNQTGLNLVINQPKKATNVKVKFFDAEACKVAKEIIESKRKKCKNKEVSHIKSFLGQEASLVESQQ